MTMWLHEFTDFFVFSSVLLCIFLVLCLLAPWIARGFKQIDVIGSYKKYCKWVFKL